MLQPSDPTFVSSDPSTGKHKFRWTSKLGCLDFAKVVDGGKKEGPPIPKPGKDEHQKEEGEGEEGQQKGITKSTALLFFAITLG